MAHTEEYILYMYSVHCDLARAATYLVSDSEFSAVFQTYQQLLFMLIYVYIYIFYFE